MPLGVGIGQVIGLVRETRGLEGATPWISVAGDGAAGVAAALVVGGDPAAVKVGGDPSDAALTIMLVDGAASPAQTARLRELVREGKGVVVLQRGSGRIPYVLPGDILEVADVLPLSLLLAAIARVAGPNAPALAHRLPLLRPAITRRLIAVTALTNAAVAASSTTKAQMPVISFAQARMLLMVGLSRGEALPHDPQQLAIVTGPGLAGCIGMGFGARALVRRLPFRGPVVRAAVAYAGTAALGVFSPQIRNPVAGISDRDKRSGPEVGNPAGSPR